ncbi:MAG: Ig-like domain-containing protein [Saprospiraceae bacterium]|nr:Ig-like domain-containing protein [Saprospiraceae bacterium]
MPTTPIVVNPRPSVTLLGPSGICIGGNTNLLPSTGGTWTSTNSLVSTITNTGLITGVSAGTVNFTYTQTSTGCTSLPSANITVYGKPIVSMANTSICLGNTTQLSPSAGGLCISSNPSVATVNGSGIVTGVSAGVVFFTFLQKV